MVQRTRRITPVATLTEQVMPAPLLQRWARVTEMSGTSVRLDMDGERHEAAVSTHLLGLGVGQRVLAVGSVGSGDTATDDPAWLVVAAWPQPERSSAPALHFDTSSGTLHIEAAQLSLSAVAAIELRCGDTHVSLSVDGQVHIGGKQILSSAMGSHRIEGASIDIN